MCARVQFAWGSWKLFELSGSRLSPICGWPWTRLDTRFGFRIILEPPSLLHACLPEGACQHAPKCGHQLCASCTNPLRGRGASF